MPVLSVNQLIFELEKLPGPHYIMFVGLVGSGKSTIIAGLKEHFRYAVLSTDDIIDRKAEKMGITYSEAFKRVSQKDVKREYNECLNEAVTSGRGIIHDQTNLVASSRAKKLRMIPDTYTKVCVVVQCDEAERQRRLKARGEATGKWIPDHVQAQMLKSYMTPSKSEGFTKIMEVRG